MAMNTTASSFYVTGGTLRRDAPSYVTRKADEDLYAGIDQGQFCYVLTSRQMGKSSLMVRTAMRLRADGIAVAVLDLTALGQNLSAEQWYEGLLGMIGEQLDLEDELEDFWSENIRVGPLQRWMRAIREIVMERKPGRLVIFVDEIDAVRSLPFSTDEFFAGIREFYNRRAQDPEMERLTFCLLGVATPSDLIRNTQMTPFNIGRRIELADFNDAEAAPLVQGLRREEGVASAILKRVLYWTGGHPYLTQRLCRSVAEDPAIDSAGGVDRLCEEIFLSSRARERDDNLLFVRERMLRSEDADRASLLDIYQQVRKHKRIADDETNSLIGVLRLAGITRALEGYLYVRNRIYYRVFDQQWVLANMPDAEVRRQRAAYRRGMLRAAAVGVFILAAIGALAVVAIQQRRRAELTVRELETANVRLGEALRDAQRQKENAQKQSQRADEQRGLAVQQQGEAEKQKAIADAKTIEVTKQQQLTEQQRAEAERLKVQAQQNLVKANAQTLRADESQKTTQQYLYAAQLNLAQQLWDRGSAGRVVRILEEQRPDQADHAHFAPGPDRRGFEWYYLWNLSHAYLRNWQFDDGVTSVAFSPDGKILATASGNNVSLMGMGGDDSTKTINTEGFVRALKFSADGKILAAAVDERVMLWDVATRKPLRSLRSHTGEVTSIAFSPDMTILASGSADKTVKLWDLKTGRELVMLIAHEDAVLSIAFSPDGKKLATGSKDATVIVWDTALKQAPTVLRGYGGPVNSIAFSPNNDAILATGGQDRTIKIWDLRTPTAPIGDITHSAAIDSVAFANDGKTLAAGTAGNTVTFWRVSRRLSRETDEPSNVNSRHHAADLSRIPPSTKAIPHPKLIQEDALSILFTIKGHDGPVLGVAFSPDGETLATASSDNTVKLWRATPEDTTLETLYPVNALAISKDSKLMAAGTDGDLYLYDVVTHEKLDNGYDATSAVAFSPVSANLLAAGDDLGKVRIFDIARGLSTEALKTTIDAHNGRVLALAFSTDGKTLATGSDDGTVRLWDVATGRALDRVLRADDEMGPIWCLAFSPDGLNIAIGTDDGTVYAWNVATVDGNGTLVWKLPSQKNLTEFSNHRGAVTALIFSGDGKSLVTASKDKTVKVWDFSSRKEMVTLESHAKHVTGLAFSPDYKRLVTASTDETLKIWDVSTWQELATLHGHDEAIFSVAFAPDGESIVTGDSGGDTRIWAAPKNIR